MLVTRNWMAVNYAKYNKLYWNGVLPDIEFKVNRTKSRWGYAEYQWFTSGKVVPLSITLSNYYDAPEHSKLTTLLHEMIHIYDYITHPEHFVCNGHKRRDYDSHGGFFMSEATRLSKDGWNIARYVTEEEKNSCSLSEKTQRLNNNKINNALLCVVSGTNGYNWVMKTSKPNAPRLFKTIKNTVWVRTLGSVKNIKFYTFKDERIATMPSNATKLVGWKYDNETLIRKLEGYHATEVRYNAA